MTTSNHNDNPGDASRLLHALQWAYTKVLELDAERDPDQLGMWDAIFNGGGPVRDAVAASRKNPAAPDPDFLKVAQLLHGACGIQANLLSTATDIERRRFIGIVYAICNDVAAPALEKAGAP